MDIVSQVEKHPRPGETVKGKDFSYIPGGKGSNQAISAHRLGGDVLMIGKVGQDAFGKILLQFFKNEGINTSSIAVSEKITTGTAFVAVDKSSENIIYVSGGANDNLMPTEIKHIKIDQGDIVSATLETPIKVTKEIFSKARKIGAKTILNAAPAILNAETLFPFVDYLIVNETELSVFAQTEIPKTREEVIGAMKKLQKKIKNIIATLGSKGAIALTDKGTITVDGHKVKAIDATAAGDCFVGAFTVALQNDKIIKDAMDFANTVAAISVQRLGASLSLPTINEVENFLFSLTSKHLSNNVKNASARKC